MIIVRLWIGRSWVVACHCLSIVYIRSVRIVTSVLTTAIWMIFMMLLTIILGRLRILSILLITRGSILSWSRSRERRWWNNSNWSNSRSSFSNLGMLLPTITCWWIMGSICMSLTRTWSLSSKSLSSKSLSSKSLSSRSMSRRSLSSRSLSSCSIGCIILNWTLSIGWWSLSCSCLSNLILTRKLVVSWWSLNSSCLILARTLSIRIRIRSRRTIVICF